MKVGPRGNLPPIPARDVTRISTVITPKSTGIQEIAYNRRIMSLDRESTTDLRSMQGVRLA